MRAFSSRFSEPARTALKSFSRRSTWWPEMARDLVSDISDARTLAATIVHMCPVFPGRTDNVQSSSGVWEVASSA